MHSWKENKLIEGDVWCFRQCSTKKPLVQESACSNQECGYTTCFQLSRFFHTTTTLVHSLFLASWSCPQHISNTNMDQHPTESTLKHLSCPSLHCTASDPLAQLNCYPTTRKLLERHAARLFFALTIGSLQTMIKGLFMKYKFILAFCSGATTQCLLCLLENAYSNHAKSSVAEKPKWACAFKGGGVIYSSLSVMTWLHELTYGGWWITIPIKYVTLPLTLHAWDRHMNGVSKRSCLWGVGVDHG